MKYLLALVMLFALGCDEEAKPAPPKPVKKPAVADRIQVLDFYATWCGPCKRNAPGIDQLEREGKRIARIDIDQSDLDEKYHITSVPTYGVLNNGVEIARCQSVSELRAMLGPPQPINPPDRSRIPYGERNINHQLQN